MNGEEHSGKERTEQPVAGLPEAAPAAGSKKPPKRRIGNPWLLILLCVAGAPTVGAVGYLIGRRQAPSAGQTESAESAPEAPTTWYCSMHPQITSNKPGKCAMCFMDLIPLEEDSGDLGPRQLKMSKNAMALADIQTTPVKRQAVDNLVRMVGKVDYDETRVVDITAWIPRARLR